MRTLTDRVLDSRCPCPVGAAGFLLVELLLGLAALGILAAAVVAVLTATSRVATRAAQSLMAGRTVWSLQVFLQEELRDASLGDVTMVTPTRITLARPIGDAMVCAASDSGVLVADSSWAGTRMPEAGRDDAWLLADPGSATWQAIAVVAITGDRCPGSNAPAIRLSLATPVSSAAVVRIMEPVLLSAYRSGIADWFGLTAGSPGSVVQPFAGPLTPGTTRWTLYPDRLETALQPDGAPATAITLPLGAGP